MVSRAFVSKSPTADSRAPVQESRNKSLFAGKNVLDMVDRIPGSIVRRDVRLPLGIAHVDLISHKSEIAPSDAATLILANRPKGSLRAELGGQRFERQLDGTSLTFSPPGTRQAYDFEGTTSNTIVMIECRAFRTLDSEGAQSDVFALLEPRVSWRNPKLERLVAEAQRCLAAHESGWLIEAEAYALLIALELARDFSARVEEVSERSLSPGDMKRAVDFIEANLGENFDLSTLADAVGREVFGFAKSFKAETGLSPHQFVIERRVERAKELLAGSSQGLAEIAYECGFCSQAHLTSTFSQRVGMPPGAYRKTVPR